MKYREKYFPFLLWVGLCLILYFFHVVKISQWIKTLLIYSYQVLLSSVIIKFIFKRKLLKWFGLQERKLQLLFFGFPMLLGFTSSIIFTKEQAINVIFNSILTPIIEEYFFRGYMLGTFMSLDNRKQTKLLLIALLSTSVCFSLAHIFITFMWGRFTILSIFNMFIYLIVGFALGLIFIEKKTIVFSSMIHIIVNLSYFIIELFSSSWG